MIRKSLNLISFWDFNVLRKLSIFIKIFEFCLVTLTLAPYIYYLVPPEVHLGVDWILRL
jgi:hypothetical protein